MRTILVPTDFSNNAYNALEYASFLAIQIGAKIVVLNAYQVSSSASNVMINFVDILEKDATDSLAELIDKLSAVNTFNNIEYVPCCCYGSIIGAIETTAKHYEVDLVVMGTTGMSSLKNKIFGSNTLEAIRKVNLPMIVVPNLVKFSEWRNITLASDEDDNILSAVEILNNLIKNNTTNISVVSVEPILSNKGSNHSDLTKKLNREQYEFHIEKNDSVVEGIVNFTENHESDVIVLLRKDYTFIDRIMHSSVTKKMTLHSTKPLFLIKA